MSQTEKNKVRIYSGKLFPWQTTAVKTLLRFPKDLIYVTLAPRQIGKTFSLEMYSLAKCINTSKPFRVVICNPTFANSKKTYADFESFCSKMPANVVKSMNGAELQIKFCNGSSIQLKSCEQGNALRGDHCNLLIIDEAAFQDMDTVLSCLFPYVNSTRGQIWLVSTPLFKSEDNLFYRFWKMAGDKEKTDSNQKILRCDWRKFDTSAILPQERKELLKQVMPLNIYLNEIEGEFLTARSEVFGDFSGILRNGILSTPNMYGGLDWGSKGTDYTVLSIFNENRQMYSMVRLNSEKNSTEQVDILLNAIKENNVKKVVYEANSIGAPMADFLKKRAVQKGVKCQFVAFDTSNKSKREIIENLQLEVQNQTITLLDDQQLKLQFAQYQMQRTKSGLITYNNSSDNIHDDIVIATALALRAITKGSYVIS